MGEKKEETAAQSASETDGAPEQVSEAAGAVPAEPGPAASQSGEAGTATEPTAAEGAEGAAEPTEAGEDGKSKLAAVAAGTGAVAAGVAGGIAVAARDTRRRVLGIPIGKRSRFQRAAGTVVDKVQEPARKLGDRFSKDKE